MTSEPSRALPHRSPQHGPTARAQASTQLELLQAAPSPAPQGVAPAAQRPVAVVQVDTALAHLDRPFEYLVPQELAEQVVPGCRVKVRFAGQDVAGFVLDRRAVPEHPGRLTAVRRVVSSEAVLTPQLLRLCRAVADHYAGTLGDVLRLAIPPRHARAEKALPGGPAAPASSAADATRTDTRADGPQVEAGQPEPSAPDLEQPYLEQPELGPWTAYAAGPVLLHRISRGEAPAASWLAQPGQPEETDWPAALAQAASAALRSGRGAILIAPDGKDVDRLDAALRARLGPGQHVRLSAEQGPQARYTAWLKVLRGQVRCVVGTRAAAYAPVADVGLLACWDDGDDALDEPRAPYPHTRDVLALRAELDGGALLMGGFTRSVPVQRWLSVGRLRAVEAPRVRPALPRVVVAGEQHDVERAGPAAHAHLPTRAWQAAKEALRSGPVLVQVPRRGYLPALSCQTCRTPARCCRCHGPLQLHGSDAQPSCRWCGRVEPVFRCPECEGTRLRSMVVGARRTAEELGRAFPGTPVHRSAAGELLDAVGAEPALVIATPGAEPVAVGGYAATLLLDAWALLDRPVLEAQAEAYRRWCAAAALTRPSGAGGLVVLCGAPTHVTLPAVEALVRWAPGWFAERELHERAELALPPARWVAELTGPRRALTAALADVDLPPGVEVLGPLPVLRHRTGPAPGSQRPDKLLPTEGQPPLGGEPQRALLRCAHELAPQVLPRLAALRAARSARKDEEAIGVRVDPSPSLL